MYFIFYKSRYRDGSEGNWTAGRLGFTDKAKAEAQAAELLAMKATVGQMAFAAVIVKRVTLPKG